MEDIVANINQWELRRVDSRVVKLSLELEVINKTGPMTSSDILSLMKDTLDTLSTCLKLKTGLSPTLEE